MPAPTSLETSMLGHGMRGAPTRLVGLRCYEMYRVIAYDLTISILWTELSTAIRRTVWSLVKARCARPKTAPRLIHSVRGKSSVRSKIPGGGDDGGGLV